MDPTDPDPYPQHWSKEQRNIRIDQLFQRSLLIVQIWILDQMGLITFDSVELFTVY
jgi:hypothetical protein